MSNEGAPEGELAGVALLFFPPEIGISVLSDADFRDRYALGVDAVISFEDTGTEFTRSALYRAARRVLGGRSSSLDITSNDGHVWQVACDGTGGILIKCEGRSMTLPHYVSLSPDVSSRMAWFDQQTSQFHIDDRHIQKWRDVLINRAVDDEELESLIDEFRLTPLHFVASVSGLLRRGSFSSADLVPSDLRYFDRLVGEPTEEVDGRNFLSNSTRDFVNQHMAGNAFEGIKAVLLLASHYSIADMITVDSETVNDVDSAFEWIAKYGDRISQVGAIECGLRILRECPGIAPSLAAMISEIAGDTPDDPQGRLRLLSSLVVMVEGEIGRRNIARGRPPFWRRLACIAHASVLERKIVEVGLESANLADWAFSGGFALYYLQSLIDLRLEPRWLPEFNDAQQLKAQFIGRIARAADRHSKNIRDEGLASILFGTGSEAIPAQRALLLELLPGPIEGGMEPVMALPAELEANIRSALVKSELTSESFSGLVNASLIFCIGSQLSELAAQGLRSVGYQLRRSSTNEDSLMVLYNLATVAAVTRNQELAQGVRILSRVIRHRGAKNWSPAAVARIATVAAAANNEVAAWSNFLAEWLTELAFGDMTREDAFLLLEEFYRLFHLAPALWETCGRAEAAIAAFIASFPEAAPP